MANPKQSNSGLSNVTLSQLRSSQSAHLLGTNNEFGLKKHLLKVISESLTLYEQIALLVRWDEHLRMKEGNSVLFKYQLIKCG